MKKVSLTMKIVIGLVLGILVGMLCQGDVGLNFLNTYIKPIGDIFLNLLKFIVVPIVLLSIIGGVVSMSDIGKVVKIGLRTVIFYLITTCFAIFIGLVVANVLKGFIPVLDTTGAEYTAAEPKHFMLVIADFFPTNIIAPFANANIMQVIVVALLIGTATILAGEKGVIFKDFVTSANAVFMEIMEMIVSLSPIGVFCLIAPVIAKNGMQVVSSLGLVLLIAYICYLIHMFGTYGLILKFLGHESPVDFYKGMAPAIALAFSSASSVGTLPVNIDCCEKLGVKREVASFVLPLGATINMDGTAIYQGVCTVFIAACYGITLTPMQMLTVIATATIASIGTAGVPGAGVVMLAMVLQSVGLPVEGIALVLGVDRLFDMGRTVVNITGDAVCAYCVDKSVNK